MDRLGEALPHRSPLHKMIRCCVERTQQVTHANIPFCSLLPMPTPVFIYGIYVHCNTQTPSVRHLLLTLLLFACLSISAQVQPPVFRHGDSNYTIQSDPKSQSQSVVIDPQTGRIVSSLATEPKSQGSDRYIVKF